MLSVQNAASFSATILVLAFVPGPDNVFVVTQAALRGWRSGMVVTLGMCTGIVVHTTAVALGVATVLRESAWAFDVLKVAGAGYLLWLAYRAFTSPPISMGSNAGGRLAARRLFVRGIVMNVSNPKIALFFVALLPQFVSAERGDVTLQTLSLGLIFIVNTILCFSLMSVLAGLTSERLLGSDKAQSRLNKVAGLVFVGLAAKLATSRR